MSQGFYNYFDNMLHHSDNAISFPDGSTLVANLHDTYLYPYQGWYYFNSRNEAETFFGITPNVGITDSVS